ncbi:tetratricopeptide repeat protein [Streptomyces dangxiongensis]|uniref:Tetratricopeptide repeat protein n=1 Tax=Streptomyces dangxiongensis TaxID=1442032 RepID=A0A3G2JC79_9ACTN|nr:tetratricopeptide repeat protein [Streptomyces dangxiongensis]AYN39211.1 tetratricopeptide repeat protein [Streptomyces dangxiongensis]
MSGVTDLDALRRALAENSGQPEGPARNARAERLLAEAERLDVPLAVIEALGHLLRVYHYSSEKDRMFVPFARLLRMWDERPGDFDEDETHSLHWFFKWMSAGMLDQPHIPLASVEKWLGEMEHRYRLAGHSERAVRSAEFSVAAHVGDLARAERAYAAWLAADRDGMADCHACELHGQGAWQVRCGRDARALELWRPVLDGEFSCAHEPHTVLAASLAPLLRLGRVEEARAHHLRGFRLVRSMESMRVAYADHVEFCALTGNEARGLELLAERPAYFTDTGHPRSRLDFLAVVTVLMDRLTGLGLGERQVPGPAGRTWTARELAGHARVEATELAGRFDRRNGTSSVGDRIRARMAQRPLVERLPLGVRAARTATAPVTAPPPLPGESTRETTRESEQEITGETAEETDEQTAAAGLPVLLAEARRLSDTLRPHALQAWAAVARAAGDGAALGPRDRAEIADHEAMGLGAEGTALFEQAAELYAEAGDPGEALAARARGAYVRALAGEVDAALATVTGLYDEVLALYADEGTGVRQTASVVMSRARILMRRVHESAGRGGADTGEDVVADAEAAAGEVLALVEGHGGDDVRPAARAAEARAMLAELAGFRGDAGRSAELFRRAAGAYVAAGLPWFAVEYEVQVAALAHQAGDLAGAERALRAALEHGGPYVEPVGRAQLHLQLAEVLGGRDAAGEAAEHALEAAHWADEAGESGTLGAWARQQLGGFLLREARYAEAAEVLESALADLSTETHGDGAVVQTRWWLGDCLGELGEHRAAAEHRLKAADIARHWPEQQDHATLAHLAAESLGHAGLADEADRAYVRAGDLWRALGNAPFLVRALRARAWLALRGESGARGARALMAQAVRECERALAAAGPPERAELIDELGGTHRQFAELLAGSASEEAEDPAIRAAFEAALEQMTRAAAVFGALGAAGLHSRTGAELGAGWLEADLNRPARAAAHARAVLAAYEGADDADETVRARRAEAAQMLEAARDEGGEERTNAPAGPRD